MKREHAEAILEAYLKLRRAEDCIRRALDQCEGEPDLGGQRYIERQLELADDFNTDAMVKLLGISEAIDMQTEHQVMLGAALAAPAPR